MNERIRKTKLEALEISEKVQKSLITWIMNRLHRYKIH